MERKVQQDVSKKVEGVNLQKADIVEIAHILSSGGAIPLAVETDGYRYASLEELLTTAECPREITLQTDSTKLMAPHIGVDIQNDEVRLHARYLDDAAFGFLARIEEVLKRRQLHRFWVRARWWSDVGGGGLAFGMVVVGPMFPFSSWGRLAFSLTGMLLMGAVIADGVIRSRWKKSPLRCFVAQPKPIDLRGAVWDVGKILIGVAVGTAVTLSVQGWKR